MYSQFFMINMPENLHSLIYSLYIKNLCENSPVKFCEYGQQQCLEFLNIRLSSDGEKYLPCSEVAAANGYIDTLEYLIRNGIIVHYTAIIYAADRNNQSDTVRFLLDRTEPETKRLYIAIKNDDVTEFISLSMDNDEFSKLVPCDFDFAVYANAHKIIQEMIRFEANIKWCKLQTAVDARNEMVIMWLLDVGVIPRNISLTPLIESRDENILIMLLYHGARVTQENIYHGYRQKLSDRIMRIMNVTH